MIGLGSDKKSSSCKKNPFKRCQQEQHFSICISINSFFIVWVSWLQTIWYYRLPPWLVAHRVWSRTSAWDTKRPMSSHNISFLPLITHPTLHCCVESTCFHNLCCCRDQQSPHWDDFYKKIFVILFHTTIIWSIISLPVMPNCWQMPYRVWSRRWGKTQSISFPLTTSPSFLSSHIQRC